MSTAEARTIGPGFLLDGYAVVPTLLPAPDAAELCRRLQRAERPAVAACERPNNVLLPLRWNDPAVLAVLGDDGRLGRLAAACGARDLRWTSGYVSVMEPGAGPIPWHQDWWCWYHPVTWRLRAAQAAVLCYLDDTTAGTGALRLLPETQRRSVGLHDLLPDSDEMAIGPGHPAMGDHPDQVTVEARAGDAVVVDYRLLHGTHPNGSAGRRHCLVLNFAPDWNELPDDIRGHLASGWGLPTAEEQPTPQAGHVLPGDDAPRRDLPLDRRAPSDFDIAG